MNNLKRNINSALNGVPFLKVIPGLAETMGVSVYIVGGYVRDIILNRKRDEIDFLVVGDGLAFTNNLAKILDVEIVSVFKNFGTAHFVYDGLNLEFVGARKESYAQNSRKPTVTTGTFDDDISRRDFTINTLAISLNNENFGELIDTYNGLVDIEKKIIKTPLDPLETFNDDPLRIMRAFRFATSLNFEIEDRILSASAVLKERLNIVSRERINDEFFKILKSDKPSIGLLHMYNTGVMEIVFPEIAKMAGVEQRQDFHHKDVLYHTCQVVDNVASASDDLWLRFAALVHDIAKPQTKKFIEDSGWTFHGHDEIGARMMKSVFKRLKLPLYKIEFVKKMVRLHLRPIALAKDEVTDSAIRRLIVEAGEDLEALITLCRADITSKNQDKKSEYLNNYEKVMSRVLEVKEKDKLREFQSPVRGDEIMEVCGLKPCKKVGLIKSAIEEAILDGRIGNNYEESLQYLYEIKDSLLKDGN
jgi:putative nucleotidyltransferase with HDIG domain